MRKLVFTLALALLLGGCSSTPVGKGASTKNSATVEVAGPVKFDKKATTTITGKGFNPGEELNVLFTAEDGMQSDINYGLKPAPKPDSSGSWSSTWEAGDFVANKMVKAGKSYKLTVTDGSYQPLAQTSVQFVK